MIETVNEAYQRFLKAQEEKSDDKFSHILFEFREYNDVEKLSFLNNVMKNNEVELFECLLRLHKDIILIEDDKESTLLHHASMNNYPSFVYILTKQDGIELDEYNFFDQTPLILACTYGHKDVIEVLLRYGNNIDLMDAIDVAQMSEQEDILEMLLAEQDERQAMAMFRKIRKAQDDMKKAKCLKQYDGYGEKAYDKKLSFMTSLMTHNDMDMFKMILETRKDIVSARDEDGWTILHNAVTNNNCTVVNVLLKVEGIEIDAIDYCQTTPLMLACRSVRQKQIVNVLLEHGSNVLLKDNNGWNALDIAKRAKQKDILRLLEEFLLKKGLTDNGKLAGQYL